MDAMLGATTAGTKIKTTRALYSKFSRIGESNN